MNINYKDQIKKIKSNFSTDPILWECEVKANLLAARTMLLFTIILVACWILNIYGVFDVESHTMNSLVIQGLAELLIPIGACKYYNGEKKWLKYFLMLAFTVVLARMDSVLTFNVMLISLIPVVLSCRYYSEKFTMIIAIVTSVLFALSAFCGAYFGMGYVDRNFLVDDRLLYTKYVMTQSFIPKWLIILLVSTVCVEIARAGRNMVFKQDEVSRNNQRIETELDMAKKIQEGALPIVHSVTQEDKDLFDLSASMVPAKEVGGDFYDFLYIDSTHLALMMADVSGKGIPAALFMMVSKLLLDNSLQGAVSPASVLTTVNHQLCEKDLQDMFVTVWLGILDLETGKVTASNAGHEYPIICRKDGDFEIFKDKHGLVLGGMDGIRYSDYEFELGIDDVLFVYTDGVAEANNIENQFFGMERTLESLNRHKSDNLDDLISGLKADIDAFAGDAPQFDDTTMMAIRLKKFYKRKGITVSMAMVRNYESSVQAAAYVRSQLEGRNLDPQVCKDAEYLAEQIITEITDYNSATFADVFCSVENNKVSISIKDNGLPYDYTSKLSEKTKKALEGCNMDYKHNNGHNMVYLEWEL